MTDEKCLKQEDVTTLRKRVEYEDQLLNSRTSNVLTLNGLMAVAASMQMPSSARFSVAIVSVLINILWIPCAVEAFKFIKLLTLEIKDSKFAPIDEERRQTFLFKRRRIETTRFMSIIIPFLLLLGWIVAVLLSMCANICSGL